MGNLNVGPLESRGGWGNLRNDNGYLRVTEWSGFDFTHMEHMKKLVVDPAAPMGFDHWSLAGNVSWHWQVPWLGKLYKEDRDRALDECAEKVLASVTPTATYASPAGCCRRRTSWTSGRSSRRG